MTSIRKHHLTLDPPSLKDNTAVIDRLNKALRKKTGVWPAVALKRLAGFASTLVLADYKVTASLAQGPAGAVLVAVEPGDATALPPEKAWEDRAQEPPSGLWGRRGLGVALDIGSSHLQATLHDLAGGEELARATRINPQVEIGADILTRIHAAASLEGHTRLHRMLVEAAGELVQGLCRRAGRNPSEVVGMAAAGNTTMTHFFLGLDVQSLCREPYIPVVNRPWPFYAEELGFDLAPKAVVMCLPNVGSYFGGDLLAGILASGLHQRERPAILVDVGTNAEVVLGNRDWLVACAGAAGPALEGGAAKMGIVAQPGAIDRVVIDPHTKEPELSIIPDLTGRTPLAKGLCGSGLLSLVAQMYLCRIIDMRGRFVLKDYPRMVMTDEGTGYVVAKSSESAGSEPIVLNEVEIDILLRSKAAMYTILRTVTLEVGVDFSELEAFFIAGAFGNVIDPKTAITLGMLPDLPLSRFIPLGNSSLAGCQRLLKNPEARAEVEAVADRLTYLELNVSQALMNRFSAARFIPHTDAGRFPSVPAFGRG